MKNIYAFKAENTEKSASGGAFPCIAAAFFKAHPGGAVYGVRYNSEMMPVYDRAVTEEQIAPFCGSKYARADSNDLLNKVKTDLLNGMFVLVSGVPCQIASLKKQLSAQGCLSERLLTVDLVCHGTPKAALWKDYLEHFSKKYNGSVIEYNFRLKEPNGKNSVCATLSDGRVIKNVAYMKYYAYLFEKNLSIPLGCFECPFRSKEMSRPADITVGDFWGVEYCFSLEKEKQHHFSLVFPNTSAGEKYVCVLQEESTRNPNQQMLETRNDNWLLYNKHLTNPNLRPRNYYSFWEEYNDRGFEYAFVKYGKPPVKYRMKRGLIAIMNVFNLKPIVLKLIRTLRGKRI